MFANCVFRRETDSTSSAERFSQLRHKEILCGDIIATVCKYDFGKCCLKNKVDRYWLDCSYCYCLAVFFPRDWHRKVRGGKCRGGTCVRPKMETTFEGDLL